MPAACKSGLEQIRIVIMTGTRNERKINSWWDLVKHS